MAAVAGRQVDMTVPRCMCGRELGELLESANSPARGWFRLPCEKCRDIVREFWFDGEIARHDLLVMQTIDLATGQVIPEEAAVFRSHERGDRSTDRGGERLGADVLPEALVRLRNRLRRG